MAGAAAKTVDTSELVVFDALQALKAKSTTVQTLVMSKDRFKSKKEAQDWAKSHGFKTGVDETDDSYRLRQRDPGEFEDNSFRTIDITDGVKAVVGHLKDGKKILTLAMNDPVDRPALKPSLKLGEPAWGWCRAEIKVTKFTDPKTGEERPGLDQSKPLKIAGIANAAIVDRVNEMLDPRGAVLQNYLKNPKILADHDYCKDIGVATLVEPRDEGLYFEADIGYPDLAPLTAAQVENRSLIAQGIRRTVSVGFIPLEMTPAEFNDAGELIKPAVYTKWELLEISVVSVPCNADSIFQLKELQMSTKGRAAGALPMGTTGKTDAPPAASNGAQTDEPVHGTAGDYLKAIHESVGAIKEGLNQHKEYMVKMHEKLDGLHSKVDALKPGKTDDGDEDDKEVEQTPSGTEGTPEPIKGVKGAKKAIKELTDKLAKTDENVGKLAEAVTKLVEKMGAPGSGSKVANW